MIYSQKKGFVLLETLIAISIALIVIVITVQVFGAMNLNYRVATNYLSSYITGREAIDSISKDCRIALRVMDDYSGYATSDNTLVLKLPSIDSSKDIIDINNEYDYVIYRMNGADLWKTVIPGASSSRQAYDGVWKRSVQSLYLTSEGTPLSSIANKSTIKYLTIHVAISETVLGKTYSINPGTTVKLMNYEWEYVR